MDANSIILLSGLLWLAFVICVIWLLASINNKLGQLIQQRQPRYVPHELQDQREEIPFIRPDESHLDRH